MEEVKKEFIDRYNFIFNNVDIILMPLVKEKSDGSLYIDVSEEFLNDLETFLLGDIPYNETSFYRIISYDSMDDLVRARCKLIRDSIEELRTRKNIENYGIKTVFQIARNFILGQKILILRRNY